MIREPPALRGAQGQPGQTGGTGLQGPKGDTGTANVIYSPWLDVAYTADTTHTGTVIDTIGFFADIIATKLDSIIMANGEIKVYLNLGSSAIPAVVPLPYLDIYTGVSINPTFFIQDIYLYSNANAGTVTQGGLKYFQYRYILVPGGTTALPVFNNGNKTGINWNDYNQVKKFLGLKD